MIWIFLYMLMGMGAVDVITNSSDKKIREIIYQNAKEDKHHENSIIFRNAILTFIFWPVSLLLWFLKTLKDKVK
jgi:hypothetical protein